MHRAGQQMSHRSVLLAFGVSEEPDEYLTTNHMLFRGLPASLTQADNGLSCESEYDEHMHMVVCRWHVDRLASWTVQGVVALFSSNAIVPQVQSLSLIRA